MATADERLPDPDITVLLSGGLDSSLCAVLAYERGRLRNCLFVGYEQPAAHQERERSAALADALGVNWCSIDCQPHFGGRCMEVERVVQPPPARAGSMWDVHGRPGPRVVPGRNLWLVSLAVAQACRTGSSVVWIGCNMTDARNYPDCRVAFMDSINTLATNAYGVAVQAPLLHRSKRSIIRDWVDRGRDPSACWSCYTPRNDAPCGTCDACVTRENADERDE